MLSKKCIPLLVVFVFNAFAMDGKKGMVITQPYMPKQAYAIRQKDPLKSVFFAGCYSMIHDQLDLIDFLLINPQKGLEVIQQTRQQFCLKAGLIIQEKNIESLVQNLRYICNEFEQQCPLFLQGECEEKSCASNREINPLYRNTFEDRVSKKILEKIRLSNNKRTTTYTSFCSGKGYPDVVVLAKVLANKPDAKINIHLIDIEQERYVQAVDFLNISREIRQDQQMFNCESRFNECFKAMKKMCSNEYKTYENYDGSETLMIGSLFIMHRPWQQFINFLNSTFPQAKISLSVHDSVDKYFKYLDKGDISYADVIATADIQDCLSLECGAPVSYFDLFLRTSKKKPDVYNVWLAQSLTDKGLGIATLSLQKISDGLKIVSVENNECCYYSFESLKSYS